MLPYPPAVSSDHSAEADTIPTGSLKFYPLMGISHIRDARLNSCTLYRGDSPSILVSILRRPLLPKMVSGISISQEQFLRSCNMRGRTLVGYYLASVENSQIVTCVGGQEPAYVEPSRTDAAQW